MNLPGFDAFEFSEVGITRWVFRRGQGPGVIIMHELPGMIPECIRLGEAIASAGYSVYLPLFFGSPGQAPASLSAAVRLCISREFNLWRRGRKSPITDWLRALARRARGETGLGPIGAIGMCLTGSFALAMLLEDGVQAPVLSQPSLPVVIPWLSSPATRADLSLSPEQLAGAREKVLREELEVLGFRFEGDPLCPRERFETLNREFPDHFRGYQLTRDAHSVLTTDFHRPSETDRERVWQTLVTFLNERLKEGRGTIPPSPLASGNVSL